MKKQMIALAMALAFVAGTAGMSVAAYIDCKVTGVDGSTVTLDCGKKASDLSTGDAVKIKPKKKGAVIEGC